MNEFKAIVQKFIAAKGEDEKKEAIKSLKAASKTATAPEKVVTLYKKALEKTLANPLYPEKEIARLTKIVSSGSASLEKLDEFTIKLNVLRSFSIEETVEGGDDEL